MNLIVSVDCEREKCGNCGELIVEGDEDYCYCNLYHLDLDNVKRPIYCIQAQKAYEHIVSERDKAIESLKDVLKFCTMDNVNGIDIKYMVLGSNLIKE